MNQLLYLSKGELFYKQEGTTLAVTCQAIEHYKANLQAINQRKKWKTQGSGARFMGVIPSDDEIYTTHIYPSAAVFTEENHIIYSALLQDGTAIYSKSLTEADKPEGLILRKNDLNVYDIDYDHNKKRLVISASTNTYARHLAILAPAAASIHFLTEGDCHDCNPSFDPNNSDLLYYDSCGLAYNQQGYLVGLGAKGIFTLNLKTSSIDTIIEDDKYDFSKPQADAQGNLYFIRKPHKSNSNQTTSIKDIVLAPVKIIKAIFGWLDFFTQRYAGESLKKNTSGNNPAKVIQASEEELFIEGNLINVKKSLGENQKSGEKHPGIIPRSWELIKMLPTGELTTLKKGVLSYTLKKDGTLIYSNGKHLIEVTPDQLEKSLFQGNLISKIAC